MFRSERMLSTSIICIKKDTELVLEALSNFGEFHVEHSSQDLKVTDYDLRIQEAEEALANVNELRKHLDVQTAGFTDMFKSAKPTKVKVLAENWQALQETTVKHVSRVKGVFEELSSTLISLQEKGAYLNHLKKMLLTLDETNTDLAALEELKLIHVIVASVPRKIFQHMKVALVGVPAIVQRCSLTKETDFLWFAMAAKHREKVERILKIHHAETFQIPEGLPHEITSALKEVGNREEENKDQESKIYSELEDLASENELNFKSWKEILENILALLQTRKRLRQTGRLSTVKGYVPKKMFNTLKEKVQVALSGRVLVFENPQPEDPPTKIIHNRFVKPYEEITKLYGLPHYEELDPTPIIAFTFPLIFGLMFGDIGHGLVLVTVGLVLGLLIKQSQTVKNVCWIMASCGGASIFAGALFGEVFGKQLFAPLWFSPFEDVFTFLLFSLFVGVFQITSGLVLEMINSFFKHKVADALLSSLPKIAFYAGAVYLLVAYQLNFAAWLGGPILLVIVPIVILIAGKPAFVAFSKSSQRADQEHNDEDSIGQRLFESGDLITRLLSNTMSYTRILALLMAHWALVLVVYVVADLVGSASIVTSVVSGIIIVGGNIFVIALEGLIVFIHTMRLHFYEWFSKFYEGTGVEFTPFKHNFIHTELELKQEAT